MDFNTVWNAVKTHIINSPRKSPSTIRIPPDHVDKNRNRPPVDKNRNRPAEDNFKSDTDYFHVVINEMYLTRARNWFDKIDPVVYVLSEFSYNGAPQVVPVLVGPTLLKDKGITENVTNGIIFRNTAVAGPYPYRGKGLTLAVILCEARSDNPLKPLLSMVESTSDALGFSPVTGPYTKVAEILIDGFGALLNSGGVTPLVGLRDSYGPSYGTAFGPSHFALIDTPHVDAERLWVRDSRLVLGPSLETATDIATRTSSCTASVASTRTAGTTWTNCHSGMKRIQKEAASPIDDPNYKNAKTMMATLFQEILLSPPIHREPGR